MSLSLKEPPTRHIFSPLDAEGQGPVCSTPISSQLSSLDYICKKYEVAAIIIGSRKIQSYYRTITYCITNLQSLSAQDMMIKNMSFKVGQTLTIVGVPKSDATNFAVNIGSSEQEIGLHFNARFNAHGDENTVVCNSYLGGKWCEELREGGFPFQLGEEFKINVEFTPEEFLVTLSDGSNIHFPNRAGAEKYQFLSFEGEARIRSVEIK
ncbi:beta-galactoside-binding lectin [Scophthalmus maximus]|uniref:Galectin n=1 Tax=Scophthalmus maximus TaxID=52904 RepID=A0A2U9CSY8_SCOMX|nr:beta-galactoside-binding lectin [Scophthalmus maximus]